MNPTSSPPSARYDLILDLITLSGDFPASLLHKLNGSYAHTRNTVGELVAEKLIRRFDKDAIKSLRITQKGRDKLLRLNYNRFCKLLDGPGKLRSVRVDMKARHRQHRMAVAFLLVLELGVSVHRDEKAPLFEVLPWETDGEQRESIMALWATPCYYSSVDIKYLPLESRRIQGTRALGLLIPEDPMPNMLSHPYLLYFTGDKVTGWSEKTELSLSGSLFTALHNWGLHYGETYGVMIGENMGTLARLTDSTGGRDNRYFSVEKCFKHFFYIPLDDNGKLLLRFLCNPAAKREFEDGVRRGFDAKPEKYESFAYQAYSMEKDQYVFFGWDLDMPLIRNYRAGLIHHELRGVILCFDFQADTYRSLFGGLAEIQLLDINSLKKGLLNGT